MTNFTKSVHVELADEGGKVFVLEVARKDFFCEFCDVFDIEAIGRSCPANGFCDLLVLNKSGSTSSISTNLEMKTGICELRPFLLRLRFIFIIIIGNY
jgi:hypothetical protein